MEYLCKRLGPGLGDGIPCMEWYSAATDHCATLMLKRNLIPRPWNFIRRLFISETTIIGTNIALGSHPQKLTLGECNELMLNIVNEYIRTAPGVTKNRHASNAFMQLNVAVFFFFLSCCLLYKICFGFRTMAKHQYNTWHDHIYMPFKCADAYIKRNMRIVKFELERLRMRHIAQPQELIAPDGSPTLVLKMSSKLLFIQDIVARSPASTGRLFRRNNTARKKQPEFKTEKMAKSLKFIDNESPKLHLLLIFNDDPIYERKRKITRTNLKLEVIKPPISNDIMTSSSSIVPSTSKGSCTSAHSSRSLKRTLCKTTSRPASEPTPKRISISVNRLANKPTTKLVSKPLTRPIRKPSLTNIKNLIKPPTLLKEKEKKLIPEQPSTSKLLSGSTNSNRSSRPKKKFPSSPVQKLRY